MDKYRKLIQQYKTKPIKIIISGVLPRIAADNVLYSKAFSLNNCLEILCKEHGIKFVNMCNNFYNWTGMPKEDGLHLPPVGGARFGRLLREAVRRFLSKNGARSEIVRPAQLASVTAKQTPKRLPLNHDLISLRVIWKKTTLNHFIK